VWRMGHNPRYSLRGYSPLEYPPMLMPKIADSTPHRPAINPSFFSFNTIVCLFLPHHAFTIISLIPDYEVVEFCHSPNLISWNAPLLLFDNEIARLRRMKEFEQWTDA
jgi:hypothetical protein